MVEELAARHALAKEVIEGVTERAGGVPLFVEEVTHPADAAAIIDRAVGPARTGA
jgi:predicted ATPase